MSSVEQWRAVRQASGTADTDLYKLDPLRRSFNRYASVIEASFIDADGTKIDDYPYGQRVDFDVSTDGGSTWTTQISGIVVDRTQETSDGINHLDIDVVAYDHLLRRASIKSRTYNDTISNILNDLITRFTGINWVAGNVSVQNDQTINRTFKGVRVDSAISFLASQSADEEYGVNDDLEFFFRQQSSSRAPALSDQDIDDFNLPEKGKRAVNRVTIYYGANGGNFVVKEDRESQQDLKDKLNAPRGVVIEKSDTYTEVTSDTIARAIAGQLLGEQSQIRTGEVSTFGRFGVEPGDVFELSITDAGIDAVDFRVAQSDVRWGENTDTTFTIAENVDDNDDLLVALSDDVQNVRMRDADTGAAGVWDLDVRSGVETSITATLTTKTAGSGFVFGQSQLGQGTSDQLGGQFDSTASVSTTSKKSTAAILNLLRDLIQDGNSSFTDLTHLGAGTDGSEATVADTALEAAVDRESVSKFGAGDGSTEYEFIGTIPAGGVYADAGDIQELGIFDADTSGSLYTRLTHDAVTIDANTKLKVHIEVTINNDGDLAGVITDTGRERVRDLLIGESNHEPTDMVYGTGTTAPSTSDTALGNKQHEDTIDSTADRSVGITDIIETITSGDADTTNFSEVGYENAANELLSRLVFEAIPEDRTVRTNYQFQASNA